MLGFAWLLLPVCSVLGSPLWEDDSRLAAYYSAGKLDTLYAVLDRIPEESAMGQFLRGVFEADGEAAKFIYDRVIAQYPNTTAEAFALERLWQYHFTLGDRSNARKFRDFLKRRHPDYKGTASIPDFDRTDGLTKLKMDEIEPSAAMPSPPPESGLWTIQIGAFSDPNRAREVGKRLESFGKVFYIKKAAPKGELIAVQVGRLNTCAAAEKLQRQITTATRLEGRVTAVDKP